jgi:hypothetical protein
MLGSTTLRIGSDRDVRNRLGWRQVPLARTHHRVQHDLVHYRYLDHGFPLKPRCSILRCLLDHCWSKQQRSRSHVVPGQQHPWTMEACVLLRDTCRYGWCRRYCWRIDLQVRSSVNGFHIRNADFKKIPGQARLPTRSVCLHRMLLADPHHCCFDHPGILEVEQEGGSWRD